jgi:hypothetical protein
MAVVVDDLRAFVGATVAKDNNALQRCLNLATVMVDEFVDGCTLVNDLNPVPTVVRDECYLQVAAELFERQESPSGQYETGPVMRTVRPPLAPVYGLLRQWVVFF